MAKLVFEAATKGHRFSVKVWQKGKPETGEEFSAYWSTGRSIQSANVGYTRIKMIEKLREELDAAKVIDNVNYIISLNELGEPI